MKKAQVPNELIILFLGEEYYPGKFYGEDETSRNKGETHLNSINLSLGLQRAGKGKRKVSRQRK